LTEPNLSSSIIMTMTRYNLHTDDWLWSAYKETLPADTNLDEPLKATVAEIVAEQTTCDETERRARRRLEDNEWG